MEREANTELEGIMLQSGNGDSLQSVVSVGMEKGIFSNGEDLPMNYRQFLSDIIERAIRDLTYRSESYGFVAQCEGWRIREGARDFLLEDCTEPWSFLWIMQFLDLDPVDTIERLRARGWLDYEGDPVPNIRDFRAVAMSEPPCAPGERRIRNGNLGLYDARRRQPDTQKGS